MKCEYLEPFEMTDIFEEQPADLSKSKYKHLCKKSEHVVKYIEDEEKLTYCDNNYTNCPMFKETLDQNDSPNIQ